MKHKSFHRKSFSFKQIEPGVTLVQYRTNNVNRKATVLTALPGVMHARALLLATRLHPHHAVVSVSDSVCATHRCEHGGTLAGALTFGMAVRGLNTVCPVRTVRLLARLCNRTVGYYQRQYEYGPKMLGTTPMSLLLPTNCMTKFIYPHIGDYVNMFRLLLTAVFSKN